MVVVMARILRTRGRKVLFAMLLLGLGTWGVVEYLDTLPKIASLGPKVTVEIVEEVDGVGQAVSADGRYVAVTERGLRPLVSRNGGLWEAMEGLPENDRAWVTHISDRGEVFGSLLIGARTSGFRSRPGSKTQFDRTRYVIDGNSRGDVLLYKSIGKTRVFEIVGPTKTFRIDSPLAKAEGFYVAGINESGTTAYGQYFNGKRSEVFVWRNGSFAFYKGRDDVFAMASSEDGSHGLLTIGQSKVHYSPAGRSTIWKPELGRSSPWERFKTWTNKTLGRSLFSFPKDRGYEQLMAPFMASDGSWAMGTHHVFKDGREEGTPVIWEGGSDWVPLADEIRRRGGSIPKGWTLDTVSDVSADGQTIIGGAKKGKRDAPFMIRFWK